jgi:hypothetical protein
MTGPASRIEHQVIGFIGLGIMGRPMARNLCAAGYRVVVHSRSAGPIAELVSAGATAATSPAEVARQVDVVVTMLPDTPDVETVLLGTNGVIEAARAGLVVIDMSTIDPEASRAIAGRLAASGVAMLDAPVSGGERGAIDATLSIMVGGSASAFEAVRPMLAALGRTIVRVGDRGAGQVAKACNQLVVGANPDYIRKLEPDRVRRSLRLTEWAVRIFAGLDDLPPAIAGAGGPDAMLRSVTTHVPDAFVFPEASHLDPEALANRVQEYSTERADDWRVEAAKLARTCRGLDLILSALGTKGLPQPERDELFEIYAELLKRRPDVRLTSAEVAERAAPLLAQRLQADLASIGGWPLDTTAPVGLHARALIAAWRELTGKKPPIRCRTPGCGRAVTATRNRDCCDSCKVERRREDVRRSRAKSRRTKAAD